MCRRRHSAASSPRSVIASSRSAFAASARDRSGATARSAPTTSQPASSANFPSWLPYTSPGRNATLPASIEPSQRRRRASSRLVPFSSTTRGASAELIHEPPGSARPPSPRAATQAASPDVLPLSSPAVASTAHVAAASSETSSARRAARPSNQASPGGPVARPATSAAASAASTHAITEASGKIPGQPWSGVRRPRHAPTSRA
mmetsp:Transcript_253/g.700  ORF Transcript_253/g.700 Transcript_253/m.700 type:complete len:204 (+) Transcript_253:328-939(+)